MGNFVDPFISVHFIKTRNTGSGMVEIHVARAPWYRDAPIIPNLHYVTPFTLSDAQNGFFRVARLAFIFVKTANTGSGTIEVHTSRFSKDTGYGTPEHYTTGFDLNLAKHGVFDICEEDLWYFQTSGTGNNMVRIQIAPKSSNYIVGFTSDSGISCDDSANGTLHAGQDAFFIKTRNTGGTVEIHSLSRASNFQQWGLHSATCFPLADVTSGDFLITSNAAGSPDLTFIKRIGTRQANALEMHSAVGSAGYKEYGILPETSQKYVLQVFAYPPADPIAKYGLDVGLPPADVSANGYLLISNYEENYDATGGKWSQGGLPGAGIFSSVPTGPGDE